MANNTKPPKQSASADVETFLASLDHPFKPEILTIRRIFLEADLSIQEDIKWNVPSFYTSEYFATFHLRAKDRVGVILHFGAKKRDTTGITISDPELLLEWLGPDRAMIAFRDLNDVATKQLALTNIIRDWIRYVE
jgi:hypothetical protein